MLELILGILMLFVFGKILIFGIKAAWSISTIVLTIVVLPIILVVLVASGLLVIAIPVLSVLGLIALLGLKKL